MTDAVELPRVLSATVATELGLTRSAVRHRVARGWWQPLSRGFVLTHPDPPRRIDWAMVGLLAAGSTAALSGWDAVRLHGAGDSRPPPDPVLVLSAEGENRILGRVRIRPTNRTYDTWLVPADDPDLPFAQVAGAARAVADAALTMRRLDQAQALVTSAVQRRLCTVEQLQDELLAVPRQGSGVFRRAMADVLAGARSAPESLASRLLGRARVPTFELNVPVISRDGYQVACVDVLWRRLRAGLEIDSRQHHAENPADWTATLARHNRLTRIGLAVEHHPPAAMTQNSRWASGVAGWLRGRATELGVPYIESTGPARHARPTPLRLAVTRDEWLS